MTTQRERILCLARKGGLSAYQIARRLKVDPAYASSALKKAYDAGLVWRVAGGGPRKGYIYFSHRPLSERLKEAADRIMSRR